MMFGACSDHAPHDPPLTTPKGTVSNPPATPYLGIVRMTRGQIIPGGKAVGLWIVPKPGTGSNPGAVASDVFSHIEPMLAKSSATIVIIHVYDTNDSQHPAAVEGKVSFGYVWVKGVDGGWRHVDDQALVKRIMLSGV
jgi:hypothetical protein